MNEDLNDPSQVEFYRPLINSICDHVSTASYDQEGFPENVGEERIWDGYHLWNYIFHNFKASRRKDFEEFLSRKYGESHRTLEKLRTPGLAKVHRAEKAFWASADFREIEPVTFLAGYVYYCEKVIHYSPKGFKGHESLIQELRKIVASELRDSNHPETKAAFDNRENETFQGTKKHENYKDNSEKPEFQQRAVNSSRPAVYVGLSAISIIVLGFLFSWLQKDNNTADFNNQIEREEINQIVKGQVQNSAKLDELKSLLEKSQYPDITSQHLERMLLNDDIPKQVIIKSLQELNQIVNISSNEISDFFDGKVSEYKGLVNKKDVAQPILLAKDEALKYASKGDYEGAEEIFKKLVKNYLSNVDGQKNRLEQKRKYIEEEKINLKKQEKNIADSYDALAKMYLISGNYRKASNAYYDKLSYLDSTSEEYSETGISSMEALVRQGEYYLDEDAFKLAIARGEKILRSYNKLDKGLKDLLSPMFSTYISQVRFRYVIAFSNNSELVKAEESLENVFGFCENYKQLNIYNTLPFCEHALELLAKVQVMRGTRETITQEGWEQHKKRLEKSIKAAQFLIKRSSSIGRSEQLRAKITYLKSSFAYYEFLGDHSKMRDAEKKLVEIFTDNFSDLLSGKIQFSISAMSYAAQKIDSLGDEEYFLRVKRVLVEENNTSNRYGSSVWFNNQITISGLSRRLWKETKKISYLEEAIREFKAALEVLDRKTLLKKSYVISNLGIYYSDYGKAIESMPYLIKAAVVFMDLSHVSVIEKRYPDRQKFLEDLILVIDRMESIGQLSCWSEVRELAAIENKSMDQLFVTVEEIKLRNDLPTKKTMNRETLEIWNKVHDDMTKTSGSFFDCLPKFRLKNGEIAGAERI